MALKKDDPKVFLVGLKSGNTAAVTVKGKTVDDIEIDEHWNTDLNRPLNDEEFNELTAREGIQLRAWEKINGKKPGGSKRKPGVTCSYQPVKERIYLNEAGREADQAEQ